MWFGLPPTRVGRKRRIVDGEARILLVLRPQTSSVQGPYDPSFYAPLVEAEDRHFWFRARNRIIDALVRQTVAGRPPGYRVLEVGCGTGNVLRVLKAACPGALVIGMDFFGEGLPWARARSGTPVVQGDLQALPFVAPFDLIGLFDVLEHLEDDRRALRGLRGLMNPNGVLLLTVPAHASLWSHWDEVCRHHRRYAPGELQTKLLEAGFRVEYLTQFMTILFPLMWMKRRLWPAALPADAEESMRQRLAEQELRVFPGINGLLNWMCRPERWLMAKRRRLPLGTSLLALARKAA